MKWCKLKENSNSTQDAKRIGHRHGSTSFFTWKWDCHHHKFLASNECLYFIVHDTSFNGSCRFSFSNSFSSKQIQSINELKINYKLNIIRNFFEESFFFTIIELNWIEFQLKVASHGIDILRFLFACCGCCTKQFLHRICVPYMKSK